MFLIDLFINDDSVASAVILSVSVAIVVAPYSWWQKQRSRT